MGFSIHYFQEYNFILTKITGEVDDGDLAYHVAALNQKTDGIINLKELADCREVTVVNLTTRGTTHSAGLEKNKPGSKLAILTPEGNDLVFAMARAYQMFSEDFRESVRLFRDLHEALEWLTDGDLLERKSLTALINDV